MANVVANVVASGVRCRGMYSTCGSTVARVASVRIDLNMVRVVQMRLMSGRNKQIVRYV